MQTSWNFSFINKRFRIFYDCFDNALTIHRERKYKTAKDIISIFITIIINIYYYYYYYYIVRTRLVILCEKYDRRKILYDRDKRESFFTSNYTILKKKNAIRIHWYIIRTDGSIKSSCNLRIVSKLHFVRRIPIYTYTYTYVYIGKVKRSSYRDSGLTNSSTVLANRISWLGLLSLTNDTIHKYPTALQL